MNPNVTARKVLLLTHESGNNKYYDCSFTLRPTFKPNSRGQYKITVNEALFNNTEPFINKDDYIDFIIKSTTGDTYTYRIQVIKDYYLFKQGGAEWQAVIQLLKGSLLGYTQIVKLKNGTVYTGSDFSLLIKLMDDSGNAYTGTNRGVNPIMYYDVYGVILPDGDVESIQMHYSWGFVYILNNTNNYIKPIEIRNNTSNPDNDNYIFQFCNLRLGGAYFYVIDLPTVKTDVMTMNESNQCYSIVGCTKNTADNHNENVQFISSMVGSINSLSDFRVRLLNDAFEPVRIRSPLYVQITISNDDE